MATYSNNTTIKIGSTVSIYQNITGVNSVSESYTVPANSYLVVYFSAFGGGGFGGNANITYTYPGFPAVQLTGGIPGSFEYVSDSSPPGTVGANPLAKTFPAGTVFNFVANAENPLFTANYQLIGQLFQNTP
jgi:hypothetical protein